eukprot:TRINITY_DN5457_c0_g3_i1.p1 TRINITY_DN5457_c0_g3~~TRINITY_DN5457_c0_g3_i1.p1  ORF type:complete len:1269 (-),score=288.08 TRINITY_DN5457_c0_g3_i1:316-4122(-)
MPSALQEPALPAEQAAPSLPGAPRSASPGRDKERELGHPPPQQETRQAASTTQSPVAANAAATQRQLPAPRPYASAEEARASLPALGPRPKRTLAPAAGTTTPGDRSPTHSVSSSALGSTREQTLAAIKEKQRLQKQSASEQLVKMLKEQLEEAKVTAETAELKATAANNALQHTEQTWQKTQLERQRQADMRKGRDLAEDALRSVRAELDVVRSRTLENWSVVEAATATISQAAARNAVGCKTEIGGATASGLHRARSGLPGADPILLPGRRTASGRLMLGSVASPEVSREMLSARSSEALGAGRGLSRGLSDGVNRMDLNILRPLQAGAGSQQPGQGLASPGAGCQQQSGQGLASGASLDGKHDDLQVERLRDEVAALAARLREAAQSQDCSATQLQTIAARTRKRLDVAMETSKAARQLPAPGAMLSVKTPDALIYGPDGMQPPDAGQVLKASSRSSQSGGHLAPRVSSRPQRLSAPAALHSPYARQTEGSWKQAGALSPRHPMHQGQQMRPTVEEPSVTAALGELIRHTTVDFLTATLPDGSDRPKVEWASMASGTGGMTTVASALNKDMDHGAWVLSNRRVVSNSAAQRQPATGPVPATMPSMTPSAPAAQASMGGAPLLADTWITKADGVQEQWATAAKGAFDPTIDEVACRATMQMRMPGPSLSTAVSTTPPTPALSAALAIMSPAPALSTSLLAKAASSAVSAPPTSRAGAESTSAPVTARSSTGPYRTNSTPAVTPRLKTIDELAASRAEWDTTRASTGTPRLKTLDEIAASRPDGRLKTLDEIAASRAAAAEGTDAAPATGRSSWLSGMFSSTTDEPVALVKEETSGSLFERFTGLFSSSKSAGEAAGKTAAAAGGAPGIALGRMGDAIWPRTVSVESAGALDVLGSQLSRKLEREESFLTDPPDPEDGRLAALPVPKGAIAGALPVPPTHTVPSDPAASGSASRKLPASATGRLAFGGQDGKLRILDLSTETVAAEVSHESQVSCVAWSPGGTIALGTAAGKVYLYEGESLKLQGGMTFNQRISCLAWRQPSATVKHADVAEDRRLLIGRADGRVTMIDCAVKKMVAEVPNKSAVRAVAWSPSGKLLASGCEGGVLKLLDSSALACSGAAAAIKCELEFGAWVRSIVFGPTDKMLALVSDDRKIRIIDTQLAKATREFDYGFTVLSLSWGGYAGGPALCAGCDDGAVRLLEAPTGQVQKEVQHGSSVQCVAWSSAGAFVAAGCDNGGLHLSVPAAGNIVLALDYAGPISSVAWCPVP